LWNTNTILFASVLSSPALRTSSLAFMPFWGLSALCGASNERMHRGTCDAEEHPLRIEGYQVQPTMWEESPMWSPCLQQALSSSPL
jgi:hypothetical protein